MKRAPRAPYSSVPYYERSVQERNDTPFDPISWKLCVYGFVILILMAVGAFVAMGDTAVRIIGPMKLTNFHTINGCVAAGPLLDELHKDGAGFQIFGAEGLVCRAKTIVHGDKPSRWHNTIVVLDYKDGTHAVAYGNFGNGLSELCAVDDVTAKQRSELRQVLLAWNRVAPDSCGACALKKAEEKWCGL